MIKEASSLLAYQAPVFETITEQILVKPATTQWTKGKAIAGCLSANPEDCKLWCLSEIPAQYQTLSRQVLQKPATVVETPISAEYQTITKALVQTPAQIVETTVPAVYRTVQKVVLKTPATTREIEIPAEYSTVTTRKLVKQGGFTDWVEVLCEAKITRTKVAEIQQALKAKGYDVGAVDNVLGERTKRALVKYQKDAGLPVGNLNMETMRSLGTEAYNPDIRYDIPSEYPTETEPSTVSDSKPIPQQPNAGILTAGEINDFSKWELWSDMTFEELHRWENHWQFSPKNRYVAQLTTSQGAPLIDQEVQLLDAQQQIIWKAKTDNTGKAELWVHLFGKQKAISDKFTIQTSYQDEKFEVKDAQPFHKGINFLQLPIECQELHLLDMLFVVDATGSMGDEIRHLKIELQDVVTQIQTQHPTLHINLGSVFYRDEKDEYLTRHTPLSNDIAQTIEFLQQQGANGGGDQPEAVHSALEVAIEKLEWSSDKASRLLFLVLDASPHHEPTVIQQLQKSIQQAASKGIRIIPIASSGIAKDTEYLMRSFALATNGTYTFLTDHSGVGNPHLAPSTDDYDMEFLNDLLVRIVDQSLQIPECPNKTKSKPQSPKAIASAKVPITDQPKAKVKTSLQFFPNPTSEVLHLKVKTTIEELFVSDFSGKILLRLEDLEKGKHQVKVEEFPSGFYFLKYIEGDNWRSEKFIIAH